MALNVSERTPGQRQRLLQGLPVMTASTMCSCASVGSFLLILGLERDRLELLSRMAFDIQHVVDPFQNDGEGAWFAHVFGAFHESVCFN